VRMMLKECSVWCIDPIGLPVASVSCDTIANTRSLDAFATPKIFTSALATISTSVRAMVVHSALSRCASGATKI
jgi:hypothetical protein